MRVLRCVSPWIAVFAVVAAARPASATTYSWNVGSGDWFTSANWSPNGVPGAGDNVVVGNGGTCTLNSDSAIAQLQLNSGTLTGTATLSVSGLTTWTGGGMSGSGTTRANGGLALGSGGSRSLTNRTFVHNSGTATVSGGSVIAMSAGATFTNNATIEFANDGGGSQGFTYSSGATPSFVNAGTVRKLTGNTGTSNINAAVTNTGSIEVQSGTLNLATGTGTHSNATVVTVGTAGTLSLSSAQRFDPGSSISGSGTVRFSVGTIDVLGNYSVPGVTQVVSGTVNFSGTVTNLGAFSSSGGLTNLNAGAAPAMGTLTSVTISSGVVTFATGVGVTMPTLSLSGGTLQGSDNIDVSGLLTWTSGAIGGSGSITASGGLNLGVAGNRTLTQRNFIHQVGTAAFNGSAQIILGSGATFTNNASVEFTSDGGSASQGFSYSSGTIPTVTNNGVVRKQTGNTGNSNIAAHFVNNGTVEVRSATLTILTGNAGVSNSGSTAVVDPGATLHYSASHTFVAGSQVSGAGTVRFSVGTMGLQGAYDVTGATVVAGGTSNFTGAVTNLGTFTASGGTANLNAGAVPAMSTLAGVIVSGGTANFTTGATATTPTLSVSSGSLAGSDAVVVTGLTTWTGGTMSGSSAVSADGGLSLSVGGSRSLNGRTFRHNAGVATFNGDSRLSVLGGGVFINNATIEFINDAGAPLQGFGFPGGTPSSVINNGTLRKLAGNTGTSILNPSFSNTGVVEVLSGTLSFGSAYTQTAGTTRTNGGTLVSSSIMQVQGGVVEGIGAMSATINNTGGILQPGVSAVGQLNVGGAYAQGSAASQRVEIGGVAAGAFDKTAVAGAAALAGGLEVTLVGGFSPQLGDSFKIMTYSSATGDFASMAGQMIGAGLMFRRQVNPTDVTLVVVEAPTPTATSTGTSTTTATTTMTATGSPSASPSPTPTLSPTATESPTSTPTLSPSSTPVYTATGTPTDTYSPIPIETETPTPTLSPSATPSETNTPSASPTASGVPTYTPTVSAAGSPTPTSAFSYSPSPGVTFTASTSATLSPEVTPTETATASSTPTPTETTTPVPTGIAGCYVLPSSQCLDGQKTGLSLQLEDNPSKNKFVWRWGRGNVPLRQADFGNPVAESASYRLCLYATQDSLTKLLTGFEVRGATQCGGRPCWRRSGQRGWLYRDRNGLQAGAHKLALHAGGAGSILDTGSQDPRIFLSPVSPRIAFLASGPNVVMPAPRSRSQFLSDEGPVVVQLWSNSTSHCWTSSFLGHSIKRNTGTRFRGKL